jgi:Uma2 family endonuclease
MVHAREEVELTMAEAKQRPMSVEEFLEWNLSQDQRYELVDGFPVPLRAMAGATRQHDMIVVNVIAALRGKLRGGPCMPCTADTAVRTKIKSVRRPDVTIECAPPERGALEARSPVAVFEVLSPTTRKLDRSVKLEEYRRHPSLQTIVHIDPDEMDVVVYARTTSGDWEDARLGQPDDIVHVTGTPAALRLSDIYEGVPVEAPTRVAEKRPRTRR